MAHSSPFVKQYTSILGAPLVVSVNQTQGHASDSPLPLSEMLLLDPDCIPGAVLCKEYIKS